MKSSIHKYLASNPHRSQHSRALSAPEIIILSLLLAVPSVFAANATHTWSGAGPANWSVTGNPGWDSVPNAAGDIAQYNTAATAATTTLDQNATVGQLQIGTVPSAGAWTIAASGGNVLTLDGSGITSGNQVFGNANTASITARSASGGLFTINPNISFGNTALDIGGTGTSKAITIAGNITATSATNLTFRGSGSGLLTISGGIGASGSSITITNARGSGGGVTLSGVLGPSVSTVTENSSSSVLTLSGANTFSGGTVLQAGTMTIIGTGTGTSGSPTAGAVGTGTLTLAGGTLNTTSAGSTIYNNITVSATTAISTASGGMTLAGNISGNGTINESGANTGGTHLSGDNSGFSGTFTSANASNHRVRFDNVNSGSALAAWTFNNNQTDGTGFSFASGTISFGAFAGSGQLRHDAAGTVTLSVGNLNTDTTWSGNIVANGANILALTKIGTGTLTISSANAYTGPTTVNNGKLKVTTGSLAAGSAVTVNGPGALAGSGTINGSVTLSASSGGNNAGINLQDGAAATLTLASSLTLNDGNVLTFDVSGASTSDKIAVTGTYTGPSSGTVTVNLNNLGVSSAATINLITTSGTMDASKFTLATVAPTGYAWYLQASGGNLQLVITPGAPVAAFWKGGVDGNWSTADSGGLFNWAPDSTGATSTAAKPGIGTAVTFSATGAGNLNTTLGGNFEIGSLTFNSASGTVTIGGANTLTNDGGITLNPGAGNTTISANSLVLGGNQTLANNSSSALSISSPVSGAYSLTVNSSGSGAVTLSGNNSYTGVTTVTAGTLVLAGDNTSATGSTTVSSMLQLQNANAVAGSALTLNSGSTLNLRADADTTFTAASIASIGGTVTMNADQITSGGGNGGKKLTLNNNFSMNASSTLNVTAGSSDTLALGTISLSAGGATETLSAASGANATIAGVQAGGVYDTLAFSGAGNIDVLGAMQENTSARWLGFQFNQSGMVTLWAANSLRFDNAGTVGNSVYHPTISCNGGVTVLNNSGAFNMNSSFGSIVYLGAGSGDNSATVLLGGTESSGLAGGITMNPPIWSGANSGTIGVRDTTSGTLTVGGQNTSGVNTWGCNFTLGSSANTGKSLTLLATTGGEVDFTGALLANGTDTSAAITVNDGTHAGLIKLAGANTYGGGTTINAGRLLVNGSLAGSGAVTVNGGATLGGTGGINGTVTVSSGGTLSPGASIGTLYLTNSPTLSGTTLMEINTTNSPATNDLLVVSGNPLTFGGTLSVTNTGDPLVGGESFTLFSANSLGGAFSATNLPTLSGSLNWYLGDLALNGKIYANRPPTANDKSYTRSPNTSVMILKSDLIAGASDADGGDAASFDSLLSGGSQGATIYTNTTAYLYEPANNNNDTLTFRVKDNRGGTVVKNITITVDSTVAGGAAQNIGPVGGGIQVTFGGIPGFKYDVQRADDVNFTTGLITILTTNAPGNGVFTVTDTNPSQPSGYYRLKFNPD